MALKKRIGVVLCGCGHRDGSEIHEATLTLLAIDLSGAEAVCMAPKGPQRLVRNHLTGEEADERREMLVESARIARGKVRDIAEIKPEELDALIIPGGQGAGINLSDFLLAEGECTVNSDLARLVAALYRARKPLGAVCIAPAALARALEMAGVSASITIGTDESVAKRIEAMGHRHRACPPTSCEIDAKNRVVTTPAYMTAKSIGEVWEGVRKLVEAVVSMCEA